MCSAFLFLQFCFVVVFSLFCLFSPCFVYFLNLRLGKGGAVAKEWDGLCSSPELIFKGTS